MERYSVITDKRPREIVLLRGKGCAYRKCAFCDYHLDSSTDVRDNYNINAQALGRVTGRYGELEVINSGSVFELDRDTLELIKRVCAEKGIHTLHFEAHYMYAPRIAALRKEFEPVALKMKLGLETFDFNIRENYLKKGIAETDPAKIAADFDEANFLFGVDGQTAETMRRDVELGLEHFERVCLNVMCENSAAIEPNARVKEIFMREIYPIYKDDARADILVNNTDFGVGD